MLNSISSTLFKSIATMVAALMLASASYGGDTMVCTTNVSDHKLALKGYDAVAYFNQGAPVAGKSRFRHIHKGVEYRFSTAENRDRFAAKPAKYEPQYGGFCAFGASVGLKLEVDPEAFEIVEGKLYLNNSPEVHAMWLKDPSGRIKAADRKWKNIRTMAAASLSPTPYDE